jgi:hypothetical protein
MVLAGVAVAAEDDFSKLRDRAKSLDGLGPFLDKYIGNCEDPFTKVECMKNAAHARQEMEGKLFYLILDERAVSMIHPAAFDPNESQYRLDLTPYFEADGRSLTDGAPKSQDDQGRPRLPILPIWAKLQTATPMDVERLFRTGNVKIQLIFKPLGVWKLPRKDKKGEMIEGVKARFVAIRLSDTRSAEEIAVRIRE